MKRKVDRGQAILLALVGLLILAIGMYTSYNLSRAVYEKIQLQNAADATAYSLAALEARSFNFFAFANRAQVANYAQMLESQSLLSSATFVEGFTAWAGDACQAFGRILQALGVIPWLRALGTVGDALVQIGEILERAYDPGLKTAVDTMSEWQPKFVYLKSVENEALLAVSSMLFLSTMLQVGDGAHHIATENDPDARRTALSFLLNGLNAVSYFTAFDWNAFSRGSNDSGDALEAKRIMAELANAARHGTQPATTPPFVVARGPFATLENVISAVAPVTDRDDRVGDRANSVLGPLLDIANKLLLGFVGTGKLLSVENDFPDPEDTGEHDPDFSGLTRGQALYAKDTVKKNLTWQGWRPGIFPDWYKDNGVFASVVSERDRGLYCRYKEKPSGYGRAMRVLTLRLWNGREFECQEDDKYSWKSLLGGGIGPYFKFAPKLKGVSAERQSFNQPDVWVFLNKRVEAMELAGHKDLDFEIRQGHGHSAELDARIGEGGIMNLGFGEGMNVLARAQVYYHRPGAWHEPPNFFNPYWGARLAPKNVAIKRLASELGLGDWAAQLIGDNVWMH